MAPTGRGEGEEQDVGVLSAVSEGSWRHACDKGDPEDTQKKQEQRMLRLEADTTEAEALWGMHQRVGNVEVRWAEMPAKGLCDRLKGDAGPTSSATVDALSALLSVLQQQVEELDGKMRLRC